MCGHPEAMGGRTLDGVGGTQSLGAANNYSPQHPPPESSDALLYPGSIAMILNRLYPRCSFLITL
jgi:hypothetical protein